MIDITDRWTQKGLPKTSDENFKENKSSCSRREKCMIIRWLRPTYGHVRSGVAGDDREEWDCDAVAAEDDPEESWCWLVNWQTAHSDCFHCRNSFRSKFPSCHLRYRYVSWHVLTSDLSAWSACCRRDKRIASLLCAFLSVAEVRRIVWTVCHRTASCKRMVSHLCAIVNVLSGETFCRTLFHNQVCGTSGCSSFADGLLLDPVFLLPDS